LRSERKHHGGERYPDVAAHHREKMRDLVQQMSQRRHEENRADNPNSLTDMNAPSDKTRRRSSQESSLVEWIVAVYVSRRHLELQLP
jgi:hypothetical protein